MEIIKKIQVKKPERCTPSLFVTIEEMVQAVNRILNPGKDPIDWFAGYSDAQSAVRFQDGIFQPDNSCEAIRFGGNVEESSVSNLKVVAYQGKEGGVYAEGYGPEVVLDRAVISLAGPGKGVGGPATGAAVKNGASMTLKNVLIDSTGKSRFCTVAEKYSTMRIYDSMLIGHGVPYGEGYEQPSGLMATPPPPLEISGNCRTHCTMSNSYTYFYNSTIVSDGWGALSTETAEGFVYLEANDSNIIVTRQGYGAYADPDCHDRFNRCRFDVDGMAVIIAGEADIEFTDSESECSRYLALMHCVNGVPEEVGTLKYTGGSVHCGQEAVRIKSHNALLIFEHTSLVSDTGILVHTILNDDPCKTIPAEDPYGVNVHFSEMSVEGDLIHEDPEREMWIELKSANYKGAIINGHLSMDAGSRWMATGDSRVTLTSDIYLSQIDAAEGVTIFLAADSNMDVKLPGGGILRMTKE